MNTVALLGTGIMGSAMARNLLRTGHDVRVWNRTYEKAAPLAADGAVVAADPAEAVAGADVVITMLKDADTVHDAMSAAVSGLRAGQVWAQMSTVGVAGIDRLAAFAATHGLVLVDAPVQGTRQPAEAGTLVILAAGPADERLESVFGAVGGKTLWVGDVGAATRLKLTTVGFGIALTSVLAEALGLAKGLGVDPAQFARVISGGPMDSPYLQAKLKAVLDDDYTPSFTVRNAEKDTRLIAEAAADAGVAVDLTEAAGERFRRAEAQGHGDEDMIAGYFGSFPGDAVTSA
ncbi:NAD(P)-dependent oxidoreductase [Streptomyces sp. SID3343]|uniref:NAD(P)-dependent oxidoreductase n=1 Tax=Streptomyces sp. SID3343 TaxID=2690260 RepID=UPI00136E972D|nr:NAD(P)-dependent oxidoreductase [Streptomyces sp. SID3343]MYW06426.1 NAD-binding protein [Streptomyces sp. SID3343]